MPNFETLNEVTCPSCGHLGTPVAKQPGGMTADVAEHVRGLGVAISAVRAAATTLHCTKCGVLLNESIVGRGKSAARETSERFVGFLNRRKMLSSQKVELQEGTSSDPVKSQEL